MLWLAAAVGAASLTAFDMTVIGTRRNPPEHPAPFHAIYPASQTRQAIADAQSVIIASHQRGSPPIVDRQIITGLEPGALLINVGRGAVLDSDSALEHLTEGRLGGLGLDVYPQEPYPHDGPLLTHPGVLATAHTAALTSDYFRAASHRLGEALHHYLKGQPPAHLLN
ncbi:MAG: NAD(P)-dependent oxidoreductase [Nocardioides sp.]